MNTVEMFLNDHELKALHKEVPMTQELFNSIIDKLIGQDIDSFDTILAEFIDFIDDYADKLILEMAVNDNALWKEVMSSPLENKECD